MRKTQAARQRTGIEDVAVSIVTRVGLLFSGLAIQSLLAYVLLAAGRGAFAVCILFSALLGVLLTPGADAGAQYFVMAKKMSISQGTSVSLAICLIGGGLSAVLSVPLIRSDIAFFQNADPRSFYIALAIVPFSTFAGALQQLLAGLRRFPPNSDFLTRPNRDKRDHISGATDRYRTRRGWRSYRDGYRQLGNDSFVLE